MEPRQIPRHVHARSCLAASIRLSRRPPAPGRSAASARWRVRQEHPRQRTPRQKPWASSGTSVCVSLAVWSLLVQSPAKCRAVADSTRGSETPRIRARLLYSAGTPARGFGCRSLAPAALRLPRRTCRRPSDRTSPCSRRRQPRRRRPNAPGRRAPVRLFHATSFRDGGEGSSLRSTWSSCWKWTKTWRTTLKCAAVG